MFRYYVTILFLCFVSAAYADIIENEDALSAIYDTKISGIGFSSSVEDIKSALSRHKIPMDCNYTEHTVVPKTKRAKATKKDAFYQHWNCKYAEGRKHKMLDVRTVNGAVFSIDYRGSMVSSLDEKDMFSYYRGIDKKLLATGIEHEDHYFTFKEDISPAYVEQYFLVKLLARCIGGPSTVEFTAELTEMPAHEAFTIVLKYRRQQCATLTDASYTPPT